MYKPLYDDEVLVLVWHMGSALQRPWTVINAHMQQIFIGFQMYYRTESWLLWHSSTCVISVTSLLPGYTKLLQYHIVLTSVASTFSPWNHNIIPPIDLSPLLLPLPRSLHFFWKFGLISPLAFIILFHAVERHVSIVHTRRTYVCVSLR